ncbi:uncharacterized protein LOC123702254 [Colias croceus]|uniref:uncharacterized protein LOC123702254 n=1 Tax=Colias crocea TaxID=72248 RepID=UPI001E28190E|nr:uncharacterized protein LOC123702254 [Colias croceus]
MGKKRKHEKTDEEIRRKIKKLENRLAKRANQSTSDSSEENMISEPLDVPSPGSLYCQSPLRDHQTDEAPRPLSPCPPLSPQEIAPRPDSPRPDEVVEPQPGTSVDNDKQNEELELDEDVLQLLGDAPKTDTSLGPAIHKDVASRWQDILSKGLPKEIKDILYKEYLVPNNCDLLLAPALNPEVKAALPEALIKRDTSLSYRQKQLGVALSALATVTQMVIANETSKQKILKPLSDACRLLCDSHHAETRTRRKFVISSINTKLKDALIETKRDALLFGENISDKLKAAKSIQQSAAPGGQQTPRQPFRSCAQHSVASTSEQQCTTTPRPDVPAFEDTSSAAEAIIDQDQPQPTQNSEVGCREAFRQALLRKGLSPSTVQIMLSSLSDSTYKQYDGCIKTWINYCSTHNYSYISASVPVVLHFLTDLFNKGAKYGTINSYKSALSLILSNLEDDRVKRFMKGVFKSRPTNPKYHITWDPSIVLEHLAQQWPNNELSLETLSKKTATLLALVTAHRVQTLALIKLKDLDIRGTSEIIIMISDLIKTSKPYSLQPLLRIPYFSSRSEICPAKCLE